MAHTKKLRTPLQAAAYILLRQLTSRPPVYDENGHIDTILDEMNCLQIIEQFLEKYSTKAQVNK